MHCKWNLKCLEAQKQTNKWDILKLKYIEFALKREGEKLSQASKAWVSPSPLYIPCRLHAAFQTLGLHWLFISWILPKKMFRGDSRKKTEVQWNFPRVQCSLEWLWFRRLPSQNTRFLQSLAQIGTMLRPSLPTYVNLQSYPLMDQPSKYFILSRSTNPGVPAHLIHFLVPFYHSQPHNKMACWRC